MALPRTLTFLRQGTGSQVLEVYLDPICPYSAKITTALTEHVLPQLRKGGKWEGKLSVIPRLYPQPFHYLAVFHVEAAIVFGTLYPGQFWDYLLAQYASIDTFKNQVAASMTPSQVRDKLVEIAVDVLESKGQIQGPKSKVYGDLRGRLEVRESPNGGNEGTAGMKHCIKIGRQNGVHVTPTVLFDGLKENSVSSSWGKEEWEKFLSERLT